MKALALLFLVLLFGCLGEEEPTEPMEVILGEVPEIRVDFPASISVSSVEFVDGVVLTKVIPEYNVVVEIEGMTFRGVRVEEGEDQKVRGYVEGRIINETPDPTPKLDISIEFRGHRVGLRNGIYPKDGVPAWTIATFWLSTDDIVFDWTGEKQFWLSVKFWE